MALTAIGRAALVSREGVKTKAYRDSVGVWTIGVGHTSAAGHPQVAPGLTITRAEAMEIFDRDLAKYEATVDHAVKVPLKDHERDALVSICYNIGQGAFAGATFVKLLNRGERELVGSAIMSWTKNKELIGRRTAERLQFETSYDESLPKGRAEDRDPVKADGSAPASAAPTRRTEPKRRVWGEELLSEDDIRFVQQRLLQLGYPEVGLVDGMWAPKGKVSAAVTLLQGTAAALGEKVAVDGHYGPQTKRLLDPMNGTRYARVVSAQRASTTASDLAKIGTPGVVQGRKITFTSAIGILSTVLGIAFTTWQTVSAGQAQLPMGSSLVLGFLPPWVALIAPYAFTFATLCYTAFAGNGLVQTSVDRFKEGIDNTGLPPSTEGGPGGLFGRMFGVR